VPPAAAVAASLLLLLLDDTSEKKQNRLRQLTYQSPNPLLPMFLHSEIGLSSHRFMDRFPMTKRCVTTTQRRRVLGCRYALTHSLDAMHCTEAFFSSQLLQHAAARISLSLVCRTLEWHDVYVII